MSSRLNTYMWAATAGLILGTIGLVAYDVAWPKIKCKIHPEKCANNDKPMAGFEAFVNGLTSGLKAGKEERGRNKNSWWSL